MNDIPGEALPIHTPATAASETEHAMAPTAESNAARLVETSGSAVETASVETQPAAVGSIIPRSAGVRNPLRYLRENRRHAAAIVVAACVAIYWFDGSSTSSGINSTEEETAQTDALQEEMMLDEFDAVEVTPLREPADPSETSADPFALTIPQMEPEASPTVAGKSSEHHLPNQSIGDVRNKSAVHAESSGTLQLPSQQSPDHSTLSSPRSVRFTGRIQPLN